MCPLKLGLPLFSQLSQCVPQMIMLKFYFYHLPNCPMSSNAETASFLPLTSHPSSHLPPHAAVEDSYQGPRLDGDITAEFMQDLLQWFKDEKRLHKKYAYKVSGESLFSLLPSSLLPHFSLSLFHPSSFSFPSSVEHVFISSFLLADNSQCEENI